MVDGGADGTRHKYPRVLLKISGESLMGNQSYGIDTEMVATVAKEVKDVLDSGVEVCLVIGFWKHIGSGSSFKVPRSDGLPASKSIFCTPGSNFRDMPAH